MDELSAEFTTLEMVRKLPNCPSVVYLYLNNPSRHNALTLPFFSELPKAISLLDQSPSVRLIVLSSRGSHFCSGIDISVLGGNLTTQRSHDTARDSERLRRQIKDLQAALTALERCRKPIIAEIDGACIGGGINIVAACDIRNLYTGPSPHIQWIVPPWINDWACPHDVLTFLCPHRCIQNEPKKMIKPVLKHLGVQNDVALTEEVDRGLVADLGALQRLPGIIGFGNTMELALVGRNFSGLEAKEMNLVSRVFSSKEEMEEGVRMVAEAIAEKSPIAVTGTKQVLMRTRDLTVDQGLDYVAAWNSAMLFTNDLKEAIEAYAQKRKPVFAKL